MVNQNLKQRRILGYLDVLLAQAGEVGEPVVDVREYDQTIFAKHENKEMYKYTGESILVRQAVAKKLARINKEFQGEYRIKVVFGYRHPDIQKRFFETERAKIKEKNIGASENAIDELTHPLIAVPSVAGHPTGGAVDVSLVDKNGRRLDMGSAISDFSDVDLLPTFSPKISNEQKRNRLILHDVMVKEGFAPFYGEWWHFSYGDREWAAFYGKTKGLYDKIDLQL